MGGGQPGPDDRGNAGPGPRCQPATPTSAEQSPIRCARLSGLDGLGAGHAGRAPQPLDRTGAGARPPRSGRTGEPHESAPRDHPAGDHHPRGAVCAAPATACERTTPHSCAGSAACTAPAPVIGKFTTTDSSADPACAARTARADKFSIQAPAARAVSVTTSPPTDAQPDPSAPAPPCVARAFSLIPPGSQDRPPTLQ